MEMIKKIIWGLSCCLILSFSMSSCNADNDIPEVEVSVGITRAGIVYDDLSSNFHAIHYILADSEGKIIENKTLDNASLAEFNGLNFKLDEGKYKLYIMGEGYQENFTHPTPEVQNPSDVGSIWFKNIRFQPIKREVFHAVEDINVGNSQGVVNIESELVRKNGTVEILIPDEITEVLSVVLLVPDAYIANAMKVDGSMVFLNVTNGTGYFWTYPVKKDDIDGVYKVQMLSSMEYSGETKPRIIMTCRLNGVLKNIEMALDGFKVEPNRITKINLKL